MNRERLLNVARALRESPTPTAFDMNYYVHGSGGDHPCGTPACALGHYAARADLQDIMVVDSEGAVRYTDAAQNNAWHNVRMDYDDDSVLRKHFGISPNDLSELFSSGGCGAAMTTTEAAEFIENFVAEHEEY